MAKNVVTKKKNDFAVLGLIFSLFVGLPGLIFSIIGLNRIKKTGEDGKGMAIAGIIISIFNILVSIVAVIFFVAFVVALEDVSNDYDSDYDYDYTYDPYDYMTYEQKCNSYWTECDHSDWYCEEYGCYCTYDDDNGNYQRLWCSSYYFD